MRLVWTIFKREFAAYFATPLAYVFIVIFLFTISGAPLVIDFFRSRAPFALISAISSFSFLTHFQAIADGVIDLRDLIFFFSLMALFLAANVVIVDLKRTG